MVTIFENVFEGEGLGYHDATLNIPSTNMYSGHGLSSRNPVPLPNCGLFWQNAQAAKLRIVLYYTVFEKTLEKIGSIQK